MPLALVVNAPPLPRVRQPTQVFVDFDMVAGLPADALIRPNHTSAELVEDLKGGFVTGNPTWRWNCVPDKPGNWLATR